MRSSVAAIHIFSVALCSEMPVGRDDYLYSYEIELWLPTVFPWRPSPNPRRVDEIKENSDTVREHGR